MSLSVKVTHQRIANGATVAYLLEGWGEAAEVLSAAVSERLSADDQVAARHAKRDCHREPSAQCATHDRGTGGP